MNIENLKEISSNVDHINSLSLQNRGIYSPLIEHIFKKMYKNAKRGIGGVTVSRLPYQVARFFIENGFIVRKSQKKSCIFKSFLIVWDEELLFPHFSLEFLKQYEEDDE